MPASAIPCYFTLLDDTPVGALVVVVDADGVLLRIARGASREDAYAELGREPLLQLLTSKPPAKAAAALKHAHQQMVELFSGDRTMLELPYRWIRGTPGQRAVWEEMRHIPAGETISYGEMAARVGNPKASRAAGSACAANPLPLLCPCHRVVRSDGSAGGFGWGEAAKRWLLANERPVVKMAKRRA